MSCADNVKVIPMEVSWSSSAIGLTDGDIEFTIEEQLVDITAHSEGTNILTAIRTGKSAEVAITLKEVSPVRLKQIFGAAGFVGQASGASGSDTVLGMGNSKDFTQVTAQAAKLVLHPANKASNDRSEDIAAWKAYPVPGSITFSGENPALASVTFRIFPDCAKADAFRLFVYGDHLNGDFAATGT
jgi:hypothetical protein